MPTTPRVGKFEPSTLITWSDGSTFSGYAYVALIAPTYGVSDDATSLELKQFAPPSQVPNRIPIPIREGKYNGSVGLWFNGDLVPPNSTYEMALFDTTKRQVTSFSSPFSVSTDPFTPPSLSPTVPTQGSSVPPPNS